MTKIGFFLYSNKIAGVENYLANLINSWPNKNHKIYVIPNGINKTYSKKDRSIL